jgi:hypothetical protein
MANQLRSLLQSFWCGAAEVFADVDSPNALAFIHQRYPTPEGAARLRSDRGVRRPSVAPIRRKRSGSITAETAWFHDAENAVAPMRWKVKGIARSLASATQRRTTLGFRPCPMATLASDTPGT